MKKILLACSAALFSASVLAAGNKPLAADDISVKTPDIKVVTTDATSAEVFMELDNSSTRPCILIAANSPVAVQTQLHETITKHGKSEMDQVKTIVIKPHGDKELKLGGFHVMLMGLKQPLKLGDNVPVTLIFADGSSLQVTAPVE
jgi:periplasmic copper chaperone A